MYSVAIAIGIHTGISHVWNPGTAAGAGTLILVFPGWSVMAVEAWHWLCQYVMQEGWYRTVFNKPGMTTDAARFDSGTRFPWRSYCGAARSRQTAIIP